MPIAATDAMYTATVTAHNGREGRVTSTDGLLDLTVCQPAQVGGSGKGTNPEQLFAATYAACFHASLAIAATRSRVDIAGSSVTAHVGIGQDDDGFGITARLVAHLPGLDKATALALVDDAHALCPYSRMTREGIAVAIDVEGAGAGAGATTV